MQNNTTQKHISPITLKTNVIIAAKKNTFMKFFLPSFLALVLSAQTTIAQNYPAKDWHLQRAEDNKKAAGIGALRAYDLLKNREAKPIIVAILDSGIDTTHEDLKAALWVNEDEIPNNGIDDDGNGFVDDVHGWNFLGGAKGTINYENLEVVRIYRNLNNKQLAGQELSTSETALFNECKKEYIAQKKKADAGLKRAQELVKSYLISDSILTLFFGTSAYSFEDVKNAKFDTEPHKSVKQFWTSVFRENFGPQDLLQYLQGKEVAALYNYNADYNPRIIVGDELENWADSIYGNNDLMGLEPSHGTHVAGIVGALRNNNLGGDGIAPNVKIMVIRVVPKGDEQDKDVANGILYAVRNGAQIINMSFGKSYATHPEWINKAIAAAEAKGVLLIHAAGNDAANKDSVLNYPKNPRGTESPFWFEVASHTNVVGKNYPSSFSNYGQNTIDIFAPGSAIYAPVPTTNVYDYKSGTSMAAPVVTGAIAFLLSYFPEVKPQDLKGILLNTANDFSKLKVLQPHKGKGSAPKVKFKTLSTGGKSLNLERAVQLLLVEEEFSLKAVE